MANCNTCYYYDIYIIIVFAQYIIIVIIKFDDYLII